MTSDAIDTTIMPPQILSTLSQPYRPAAHQVAENIRNFHAALKAAGFIGGRRGYDPLDAAAGGAESSNLPAPASPAQEKKRKATRGGGRTKGKRFRKDDEDDPSMRSPSPPPAAASGDEQQRTTYNPEERGPDEILPDRALTKAERLQLVNNAPRSLVELHTLVEELGERFTESQIEELLTLVATHIPIPPTEDEVAAGAGQSLEAGYEDGGEAGAADGADGHEPGNGLFIGGAEDDSQYVYDEQAEVGEGEDDDDYINGTNGGGDDLAGEGGNDDEE